MFQFKQFNISQEKSAMKVGTDGVLLGAWLPVTNINNALDIGSGTGLISLMIAQRNNQVNIDAIEIENNAFFESDQNFKNSLWSDRLTVYNISLQLFKSDKKYDLIVSNPPYYTTTYKNNNQEKSLARHVDNLTFKDLLFYTSSLLSEHGICTFIIPYSEEESFIKLAKDQKLFCYKKTRVRGKQDLPLKRSLLCFSTKKKTCEEDELIVELERHVHTKDYINLTKDFYLKM